MASPFYYPPTPAKYTGERHIPLPREDEYTPIYSPSPYGVSSPLPPMTPNMGASPPNPAFSPLFSPLTSAGLTSLPPWSAPSPSNASATLHVLLHPSHETILNLATPQFMPRESPHLHAPATNPPKPGLILTFANLPVTIPITPSISGKGYVTVADVLFGLYSALRQALNGQQQKQVSPDLRTAMMLACRNRGGTTPIHLDLLAGATRFVGLKRNKAYGSDGIAWEIVVK